MKLSGTRPNNLGIHHGALAPCPNKPNAVSSYATDAKHRVEPLSDSGSATAQLQRLMQKIKALPLTAVITERADYAHIEFSTAMLGFVDDVELYCDGNILHVRSASRLGYSDWGVNRKRVAYLKHILINT